MVAGAAAGHYNVAGAGDRVAERLYLVLLLPSRGLDAGALLEYLLDGVMRKLALVYVCELPRHLGDAPCHGLAAKVADANAVPVDHGDVAVVKEHCLIRILQEPEHVA